jgi:hypothetical protein
MGLASPCCWTCTTHPQMERNESCFHVIFLLSKLRSCRVRTPVEFGVDRLLNHMVAQNFAHESVAPSPHCCTSRQHPRWSEYEPCLYVLFQGLFSQAAIFGCEHRPSRRQRRASRSTFTTDCFVLDLLLQLRRPRSFPQQHISPDASFQSCILVAKQKSGSLDPKYTAIMYHSFVEGWFGTVLWKSESFSLESTKPMTHRFSSGSHVAPHFPTNRKCPNHPSTNDVLPFCTIPIMPGFCFRTMREEASQNGEGRWFRPPNEGPHRRSRVVDRCADEEATKRGLLVL